MDISTDSGSIYPDVTVSADNATINSGLLDTDECKDMAIQLLYAARNVLLSKAAESIIGHIPDLPDEIGSIATRLED